MTPVPPLIPAACPHCAALLLLAQPVSPRARCGKCKTWLVWVGERLEKEGEIKMTCYHIDYGYGEARFWTPLTDEKAVLREFEEVANATFGIRKNMTGAPRLTMKTADPLPVYVDGLEGTHALHFGMDEYLYDAAWRDDRGSFWRLHDAWDHDCTCAQRGTPEPSCELHEYDAENGITYARQEAAL